MSRGIKSGRYLYHPFRFVTVRAELFGLCAFLLAGCAALEKPRKFYPDQFGRLDAASTELARRVHYPYLASKTRRRQIERAARELHAGMSKTQAFALLGPPDIKEDYDGFPPEIPPCQTWTYVHTWRYRNKPGYQGKTLIIYFNANSPQTIDGVQFSLAHEIGL